MNEDRRIIIFENEKQARAVAAVQDSFAKGQLPSMRALRKSDRWYRINGFNRGKCLMCGKEHTLLRSDEQYCSNACRQKAYRLRKRAGLGALSQNAMRVLAQQGPQAAKRQIKKDKQNIKELERALRLTVASAKRNA